MIGPRTAIGARPHLVFLATAGAPVPDGEGGYTTTPVPLAPPEWFCSVAPATAGDLERAAAGTAMTRATHVLTGPYRADLSSSTLVTFNGRTFYVNGTLNPGERNVESLVFCEEHVAEPTP